MPEHGSASAHHPKKFELTLPVAIVFAALAISGAILLSGRSSVQADPGGSNIAVRVASNEDHIVGSPDAKIVLIEYADLQCSYCAVIHPTLKKIVAQSNGEIAWVFRHFPLDSIHPEARPAAHAAECVAGLLGNDAFWRFADDIFTDQSDMGSQRYAQMAAALGADPKAFADCVAKETYGPRIDADTAEAVTSGGQGTPYTVVMGKKGSPVPFSGALPYEQILSVINAVKSRQ